MKKFFVPSTFGKSTDAQALQFKPIPGTISGTTKLAVATKLPASPEKKAKIKKKQLEFKKLKKDRKAKKENKQKDIKTGTSKTPKIKAGRIEKKIKKKQPSTQQQQQKLKLTTALAKAVTQALPTAQNKKTQKSSNGTISSMQDKFREQLKGGHFRYLNEQLYTMDSKKAESLFQREPTAFNIYHEGYRHQVEKWPLNPLDRIIKQIRKLPKALVIADFGCGEGRLAKSVPNKVYSMDLVSVRDDIIACNMDNTPLESESVDVGVYCLSLMSTNLRDYLLEANRVLRPGGLLYIAEIQSRFENIHYFIAALKACGFDLIKQELGVKIFNFFQFKKSQSVGKVNIIPELTLKPCLYKKR